MRSNSVEAQTPFEWLPRHFNLLLNEFSLMYDQPIMYNVRKTYDVY